RLLSPDMLLRATTPQTDGLPALIESGTAGPDIRFGLGYQLAAPGMPGLGPASFGHTGAGGRLGIADPDLDVAFAYVGNSMRDIGPGGDPRWATLLDAVPRAVWTPPPSPRCRRLYGRASPPPLESPSGRPPGGRQER